MRAAVGGVPELWNCSRREELLGDVGGVALRRGRDRRRRGAWPASAARSRSRFATSTLLEDRVDDRGGDGLLDVGVLGERRDGLDVAVGVGELVVRPDRDRRQRHQDEPEDQQDDGDDALPPLALVRLGLRSRAPPARSPSVPPRSRLDRLRGVVGRRWWVRSSSLMRPAPCRDVRYSKLAMRSATPLKIDQMPMIDTSSSTERSGLPIAHAPSAMPTIPAMSGIHHPRTCVCDSAMTTSKIPRISRYQATNTEITTSVGSGHTIAAMPASSASVPPMIASQRHPPSSTNAERELRDPAEPERDPRSGSRTRRSTPAAATAR